MCQILTTIFELDSYKVVEQCEHGTIFSRWDNIIFQHGLDGFLDLVEFLRACDTPARTYSSGAYFLVREDNGTQRIWIGEGGLRLSNTDFLRWSEMLFSAAQILTLQMLEPKPRASRLLGELN